MTPLTQAEWYAKLKSWVPGWVFERDQNAVAVFQALAKTLAECEGMLSEHISATFISEALGDILDLHGYERNVPRLEDETDHPFYSVRIRNIVNQSNKVAIKQIVDELLITGECTIVEDFEMGFFCDRGYFINRGQIILENLIKDAFTILIPNQRKTPLSFLNRAYFMDRDAWIGEATDSFDVMEAIVRTVEKARAAGCLFRVVQLRGSA